MIRALSFAMLAATSFGFAAELKPVYEPQAEIHICPRRPCENTVTVEGKSLTLTAIGSAKQTLGNWEARVRAHHEMRSRFTTSVVGFVNETTNTFMAVDLRANARD